MLVANHPNMLIDGLVLGASCRRTIHFLGKSTLFSVPGLAWLLRNGGVLPVYRRRDGSSTDKNDQTFAACFELLESGGVIGIFPEGTSHSELRMLSFKTGAARIALGAAARCNCTIQIVPCGIWYLDKSRRGSDCLVVYGKPIPVTTPDFETEQEQREAVRTLTDAAENSLRALLIELDDERQAWMLELLVGITSGQRDDTSLKDQYEFARQVLEGYRAFEERQPEQIARFVSELEEYGLLLEHLGLKPHQVSWRIGRVTAFALFVFHVVRLIVGAAPALAGWVVTALPTLVNRMLAAVLGQDEEEIATYLLLGGMLTYGLWYAGLAVGAVSGFGWGGLVVLLVGPLLGRYAEHYRVVLRRFVRGIRVYLLFAVGHQVQQSLASRQRRLLAELARMSSA